MKSSMRIIKHKFEKKVTIIPISDVHIGSLECNETAWKNFCMQIQQEPDTYIVLVGDLVNNSVRNAVANPFDETLRPRDQKYRMINYLTPIKNKIIAAMSTVQRKILTATLRMTFSVTSTSRKFTARTLHSSRSYVAQPHMASRLRMVPEEAH